VLSTARVLASAFPFQASPVSPEDSTVHFGRNKNALGSTPRAEAAIIKVIKMSYGDRVRVSIGTPREMDLFFAPFSKNRRKTESPT